MPRLSHNKGKMRIKKMQRLHQKVTAAAQASDEDQDMLTPDELAAIVIALDAHDAEQPLEDQENMVSVEDLELISKMLV